MKIEKENNDLKITGVEYLDIGLSVDCGQSFRWKVNKDGTIHGVVKNKSVDIIQKKDEIIFKNITEEEFNNFWKVYFDLERDYKKICDSFDDDNLKAACKEFPGIRILKQDEWETICSFIISQNNNIPRIKGIISRLCENFGEKINEYEYGFPSFEILSKKTPEELAPLRAGFRNKYIIDAAQKFASGEIDIEKIKKMPLEEAREELKKIKGVGNKVADCSLLFGFARVEAFPVDVWVKRVMQELYPNGLPKCTKGVEGIAQQYLFHWRRQHQQ